MSDKSAIEWTEATWNPVAGCSLVSPGCTNCYAMSMAARLEAMGQATYAGLTMPSKAGPVWTGKIALVESALEKPLRWLRRRRIFVNSMSDLFHADVPDAFIDKVFAVMALCPRHTFQVLTKRADRMRTYCRRFETGNAKFRVAPPPMDGTVTATWPLPNVWLGVSVEDQARADERIWLLLDTPAAVRWVSAEPLLGPVDLTRVALGRFMTIDALGGITRTSPLGSWPRLDWVVAGGESGAGARPMHPDWARSLRDQCAGAGVPFFFKQWGDWVPQLGAIDLFEPGEQSRRKWATWEENRWAYWDRPQWCDDLGDPEDCVLRVGKKVAGRTLDGRTHNDYPQVPR